MYVKHERKPFSIVLTFFLIFSLIVIAAPQNVLAENIQPKIIGERLDLREENVKAYQLDNGNIQCDIYPTDIFYRDEKGEFKDIDDSISDAINKDNYIFTNTSDSWHVLFKDSINKENSIRIEKGKYAIEFGLISSNGSHVEKSNTIKYPKCEFDKEIAQDNRAVIYKNIADNVDLVYTALASGLKEDIILREKETATKFCFTMKLNGLKLINQNGTCFFTDDNNNNAFFIPPMFMEDANGKHSDFVKYEIKEGQGNYLITIFADIDFLNATDTVFPVRIDPSYNTTGSSYTSDTYVCSANPTVNYQMNNSLRTGKDTTYGVRETYIRFKLPSGYRVGTGSNDGITAASLKLKLSSKGSGTNSLRAYTLNSYWRSDEITWNYRPTGTTIVSTYPTVSDNWYTFDVLNTIRCTYAQISGYSNCGFLIKDDV